MDPINKDKPVSAKADDNLILFGRVERLTAGICMGTPFLLLIGEDANRALWWFPLAAVCFLGLPSLIAELAERSKIQRKNHGPLTTIVFTVLLLLLYSGFIHLWNFKSLRSISYYVTMDDSFIFGLLVTMGAMLFIANGLFYREEGTRNEDGTQNKVVAGEVRLRNSFILGLAQLGVVVFPCSHKVWYWPHMIFAVTFFAGCALAVAFRKRSIHNKTEKSGWQNTADWVPVIIMGGAFFIAIGNYFKWWSGSPVLDLFNLFGAESIGLWVIGVDFILVSLKRLPEPAPAAAPA